MKQVYFKQNGSKVTIEVSDEVEKILTETRRAIWRNDAKESYHRYILPLSKPLEYFADPQLGALDRLIEAEDKREEHEKLTAGINSLSKEPRELLQLRFFECKQIKEIALIYGSSYQAAQYRLRMIFNKLRKFF